MWDVVEAIGGQLHVLPKHDERQHRTSKACWCVPTENDGVMVHHSSDKRELAESN